MQIFFHWGNKFWAHNVTGNKPLSLVDLVSPGKYKTREDLPLTGLKPTPIAEKQLNRQVESVTRDFYNL